MPTEFDDLAYFDVSYTYMNGKCWNWGVSISSTTIFNFEQCVLKVKRISFCSTKTPIGKLKMHFLITKGVITGVSEFNITSVVVDEPSKMTFLTIEYDQLKVS